MGPEFKAMYHVGIIICSRYLTPALTETYWSVENNKKAILSDEFRLRQGYRKVSGLLSRKRHLEVEINCIQWKYNR